MKDEVLARAKVNLCLHVVGQRGDGYHLLESYVVFPRIGDGVEAEPSSSGLSLAVTGPFKDSLGAGEDNLVLQAAAALRAATPGAPGAALRLTKRLPVAGGVGGGSSDAAATLLALDRLWEARTDPRRLAEIALSLGADVPACLAAPRSVWMAGVGERVAAAPPCPPCWILLANPGVEMPTPKVFQALTQKQNPPPRPVPERFVDFDALIAWLAQTRNDLAAPAEALSPQIAELRARLEALPGAALARMSGSGSTCFALFADEAPARAAERALRAENPRIWTAAAELDAPQLVAVGET